MIDSQLRPQGVNDAPVSQAMAAVPREQFVADEVQPLAYTDRAVADRRRADDVGADGARPAAHPLMPRRGERALVVGCRHRLLGRGAGRRWAWMSPRSKARRPLAARAGARGLKVVEGPLEDGWNKGAPYDLILIDGAVEFIPDAIVAQLRRRRPARHRADRPAASPGWRSGAAPATASASRRFVDAGAAALPGFTKPESLHFLSLESQ